MGNKWIEELVERFKSFLRTGNLKTGNRKREDEADGKQTGKRGKKQYLLILFLTGVLLFVIVLPVPDTKKEETTQNGSDSSTTEETSAQITEQKAYEAYLEEKTEKLLETVEGVGKVQVMITLKSSGQKVIEKDQQNSSQSVREEDSQGGTRDTQESSSERTSIYTQESDGAKSPYVSKELLPEVEGVVVIAEGGDNAVVAQNLTEAVQALFGVEAHKIKIMKRVHT